MKKSNLEIYWNLNNLLYERKILKVTDFRELLRQYGVNLSYGQAYSLVHEQPLRVTLRTVLAICEALNCSVSDLIVIRKATGESAKEEQAKIKAKARATKIRPIPKKLIGRKVTFE